jgi:hypothetical protein
VRTIPLPSFQVNIVVPGPYGVALYGSPGAQGLFRDLAGGPTLYYYDFATRSIQTVVVAPSAPNGSPGGTRVRVAGEWIVYGDSNNKPVGGTCEIAASTCAASVVS